MPSTSSSSSSGCSGASELVSRGARKQLCGQGYLIEDDHTNKGLREGHAEVSQHL